MVAVCDVSGGTQNPNGINIPELMDHKETTGGLKNFHGGVDMDDPSEVLVHPCDVLIPCALGGVLNRLVPYLTLPFPIYVWF